VRATALRRARRLVDRGGRLVLKGDAAFPANLAAYSWSPPWLWVRGAGAFPERAAAMVGTRRATPSARAFTEALAAGTAAAGVAVVSGLALGIDAAAHRGALAAGGPTVAVLGTGVDLCYPPAHRSLLTAILADGLAVSAFPPGALPLRHHFPMRNRIMAGLCQAVVVVQAPVKSGALITADHAAECGTEVLAVPGDPLLPENAGSNRLIADGARPALGVEDVLSLVLGHEVPPAKPTKVAAAGATATAPVPRVTASHRALLSRLDFVPRDVDRVASEVGRPIGDVLADLLTLELQGFVEPRPGGQARLTPRGVKLATEARHAFPPPR
jgi:DNA processing protein